MTLDPEGPLSLLLRAGGAASFLITVVTVGLAGLLYLWARLKRSAALARTAVRAGGGIVGVYALIWVLGVVVLRGRSLEPGEELLFCGLDCHLHLTALRAVQRDGGVEVVIRARSDAKAVVEDPARVQLSLRDGAGKRWFPAQDILNEPLWPGAGYERTLRFNVPAGTSSVALSANWRGLASWLVAGPENTLVQRRTQIHLPVGPTP